MTDSTARRTPVPTLNDLNAEELAAARAALAAGGKGEAAVYLSNVVEKCNLAYAARFIDEVLLGSADPQTWGYEDMVMIPHPSLEDLLTRPLAELLRRLDDVEGIRWVRLRPQAHHSWKAVGGAPGVLTPSRPYWTRSPPGLLNAVVSKHDELEQIIDLDVAGRRWLTLQIADRLRLHPLPRTPAELAATLGVAASPSRDAEIALTALLREQEMDITGGIPGFRGPDAWFRTQ